MRVRVQKWGNSLAIRIPKPFAVEAGVEQGAEVELAVSRGRLVAAPIAAARYRCWSCALTPAPGSLRSPGALFRTPATRAWPPSTERCRMLPGYQVRILRMNLKKGRGG